MAHPVRPRLDYLLKAAAVAIGDAAVAVVGRDQRAGKFGVNGPPTIVILSRSPTLVAENVTVGRTEGRKRKTRLRFSFPFMICLEG